MFAFTCSKNEQTGLVGQMAVIKVLGFLGLLMCAAFQAQSPSLASSTRDVASPPKAQIVYSASTNANYKYKLYLAAWPNPKPRVVTPRIIGKYGLGDSIIYPEFSPDGTKVLFLANRKLPDGKQVKTDGYLGTDLWVLDVRRNTARPLTTDGDGYEDHKWSPDGRYVCAISHEGCPPPEAPADLPDMWELNLYVWEVTTGNRRFIGRNVDNVVWSPDSKSLYYDGIIANDLPAILQRSRTGGTPHVVLSGGESVHGMSPDRKRFAYWRCNEDGKKCDLLLETLATKKKKVLMSQSNGTTGFQWMPDNLTLGLLYGTREPNYAQRTYYWLFLNTSTEATRRTISVHDPGSVIAWSHTWDWIISYRYSKPLDFSTGYLVAVSTKTGEVVELIHPPQAGGFDWHELPGR